MESGRIRPCAAGAERRAAEVFNGPGPWDEAGVLRHCRLFLDLPAGSGPAVPVAGGGLLDGHPVLYTLHSAYIGNQLAHQHLFRGIPGLASHRDYAALGLDGGVDDTGSTVATALTLRWNSSATFTLSRNQAFEFGGGGKCLRFPDGYPRV